MKNIYYLQKHLVKIGDVIEYNGIKALVTKELIEFNPELFKVEEHTQPMYFKCVNSRRLFTIGRVYEQKDHSEYPERVSLKGDNNVVYNIKEWTPNFISKGHNCFERTTKEEWDIQELIDKAKRDYPIGTMFNSIYGIQKVLSDNPFVGKVEVGTIQINTDRFTGGATIYTPEDGWAEILPLKFTTEDGVNICGDMKTYLVHPNDHYDISSYHSTWDGDSEGGGNKYFYHKENALAYIEKHKRKSLEDYEKMLLPKEDYTLVLIKVHFNIWSWMKVNEPKLYYTKILQLIADDLNDGRYIHIIGNTSYHLSNARSVNVHCGGDEGCVYFKSRELAEKAKVILEDKVNYLFN